MSAYIRIQKTVATKYTTVTVTNIKLTEDAAGNGNKENNCQINSELPVTLLMRMVLFHSKEYPEQHYIAAAQNMMMTVDDIRRV